MSQPRDVWVRDLTMHTPAHRVNNPGAYDDERHHPIFQIACPPGVVAGGSLITRTQAAALEAFPCCRCFPPKAPAPPARAKNRGRGW
jgi:hypothetical protein